MWLMEESRRHQLIRKECTDVGVFGMMVLWLWTARLAKFLVWRIVQLWGLETQV
jgi:hypothetical protein